MIFARYAVRLRMRANLFSDRLTPSWKLHRCRAVCSYAPWETLLFVTSPERDPAALATGPESSSFLLLILGGIAGIINMATGLMPFGQGNETYALASNLVRHGAFANPLYILQTGPSAASPPLFPLFLALILKIFGDSNLALLVATCGVIYANALTAALLPRVSRLFFNDAFPGIVAAVLWLFSAQLIPVWDVNYTTALLLVFFLSTASAFSRQSPGLPALGIGLVTGFLFLLNPMTILITGPWLAYLFLFRSPSFRHAAKFCCLAVATMVIVGSPWILRNHRQVGAYAVRTGLGLNLYIANNDCSQTTMYEDLHNGCAALYQPNLNLQEATAVRDLGEVGYDRARLATTRAWIRNHSERFARLTVARVFAFWFPQKEDHPVQAVAIWVATALSLPGLALMAYGRLRITLFILIVLAVYPLLYYVVVSEVRFRYPILCLSLLPAGYLVTFLLRLGRSMRNTPAIEPASVS